MRKPLIVFTLFILYAGLVLPAQKAVNPSRRYYRILCLVHLTGSGKAGDPVVPEYVVQGVATAQAGLQAAATATTGQSTAAARPMAASGGTGSTGPTAPAPMSSRPGILGWAMQVSDDGTMAIVQMVAADHHAFDPILADTRPEILVYEIGKTDPATIQAGLQKYKANFNLSSFLVMVQ